MAGPQGIEQMIRPVQLQDKAPSVFGSNPWQGWLVQLIVLFAAACAPPPNLLLDGRLQLTAADALPPYQQVVQAWTRSGKLYRHLDNVMFLHATWHVPALRRAFATFFTDIYGHGGLITKRELSLEPQGAAKQHHFFLAVHTSLRRWNDLARSDSIWHLTLRNEQGEVVDPEQIVAVDVDENLHCVYPHMSRFDKAYMVRFPAQTKQGVPLLQVGAQVIDVRIASALGAITLSYRVEVTTDFMQWLQVTQVLPGSDQQDAVHSTMQPS